LACVTQDVDFNDPTLTATPKPSTTTYALPGLGAGLAVLVIQSRRSQFGGRS
jgi:hypothetical protein